MDHKFSRRVFLAAAIYGVAVLVPQYFMEPPSLTRPEFFYGFVGVALVFQFVFYLISKEPVRYRAMMVPGVLEKVSFGGACLVLYCQGRLEAQMLGAAAIDFLFGALFVVAYLRTK